VLLYAWLVLCSWRCFICSTGAILRAGEVIGIDLGTTNSCVAVMEGKVRGFPCTLNAEFAISQNLLCRQPGLKPARVAEGLFWFKLYSKEQKRTKVVALTVP
jgi:Hsp70 protein